MMETIENIRQEQSRKAQEKTSNIHERGYLDEETMDFQIDNSIRLDHWILC